MITRLIILLLVIFPFGVLARVSDDGHEFRSLLSDYRCGNPNDWVPDDTALQSCLDSGRLILDPGFPGYIVNGLNGDVKRGLLIKYSDTIIQSSSGNARIIAGRDLYGSMLKTERGLSNYSISNIIFDGMVDDFVDGGPYRKRREDCVVGGDLGNIVLQGYGFVFDNNESINAMCGSGLGILGRDFIITNNRVSNNGRDKYQKISGFPWADGITVLHCDGGYIGHNILEDNTDIDLIIGGGRECVVEWNMIVHTDKYGFAGLGIGNFNNDGNHKGSEFRHNLIYSRVPNKLAMGIVVGSHPWTTKVDVINAGRIIANTSYGNVFNMVVDGVYGGVIEGNNLYSPQGNDTNCGSYGANYIVNPGHVSNMSLQSGWVPFLYDEWQCGPL
jgi:hypothetical protein